LINGNIKLKFYFGTIVILNETILTQSFLHIE
jgi:hypothetical protein